MMATYQITTQLTANKKEKTPVDQLGFGQVFYRPYVYSRLYGRSRVA